MSIFSKIAGLFSSKTTTYPSSDVAKYFREKTGFKWPEPAPMLLNQLDDCPGIQPTQPWPRPVQKLGGNHVDYIQEGFEKFHAENPNVYAKLVELAYRAKASGQKQIGIGLLWERLRWYYTIETTGDSFRLNNNYRSRFARLIMATEPALNGFFKTRELY